ncbi:hypothetical protein P170DRAFT_274835 [Aspergillus steynii IBT 23096]|uniref:Uncharacterized protein n=1 Tax=Aspergillus steynii IBT 23096 TaxID=1392250 RepID=A0A2I2FX19_9EURO|nr:uncharacterized protein P170DRAFT_274835 [Aspergillus steynii IBT 23096]PLB45195.1 hypothetical protein P170DRAFT_274835 [Aspergillus steynii IBT 23096]
MAPSVWPGRKTWNGFNKRTLPINKTTDPLTVRYCQPPWPLPRAAGVGRRTNGTVRRGDAQSDCQCRPLVGAVIVRAQARHWYLALPTGALLWPGTRYHCGLPNEPTRTLLSFIHSHSSSRFRPSRALSPPPSASLSLFSSSSIVHDARPSSLFLACDPVDLLDWLSPFFLSSRLLSYRSIHFLPLHLSPVQTTESLLYLICSVLAL